MMNKLRRKTSMTFSLFLATIVCGIASCVLISLIIVKYTHRHAYDNSHNRISSYVSALSSAVEFSGYSMAPNEFTRQELDVLADTYNGRVILADSQLGIVYDSFRTRFGTDDNRRYLLISHVPSALSGKSYFNVDESSCTATIIKPVAMRSKEGAAGVFYMTYPIGEELGHYNTLRRLVILVCLCVLIVTLAYAVFRAYLFTQPLREIKDQLAAINSGNRDNRLSVYQNRQVAGITDAVNELLEQTQETDEKRRNFISDVSHELKTPMTSMKVLSDALLQSGQEFSPDVREFLTDINSEIDRENHIISDLLALARLDRRTDVVRFERTHINDLLDVILKRIRPLAESHEVEVVYESYRDVYADVDEAKLLTAITNIVENAILYNKPQGNVFVTLNANMTYFFVTVQDTGYGIPEAHISHIFERFYRVDKDRSRATGGTGLGLAITKEIISAHGGQIKAFSKENEGTTFSIRIPLAKQQKGGGNQ